jgi:hypothetical protein
MPSTDRSFQTTKIAMIAKTTVEMSKFGIVKTLLLAAPLEQAASRRPASATP